MIDLEHSLTNIRSRRDFVSFVRLLRQDLEMNKGEWENASLATYLDAIAAWTEDMDGYVERIGEVSPGIDWIWFGRILLAARIYE